jgi:hypothetical protein
MSISSKGSADVNPCPNLSRSLNSSIMPPSKELGGLCVAADHPDSKAELSVTPDPCCSDCPMKDRIVRPQGPYSPRPGLNSKNLFTFPRTLRPRGWTVHDLGYFPYGCTHHLNFIWDSVDSSSAVAL